MFCSATIFRVFSRSTKRQELLQAVRAAFSCPSSGAALQAAGQCRTGIDANKSASCGPSYVYDESINECSQIFTIEDS